MVTYLDLQWAQNLLLMTVVLGLVLLQHSYYMYMYMTMLAPGWLFYGILFESCSAASSLLSALRTVPEQFLFPTGFQSLLVESSFKIFTDLIIHIVDQFKHYQCISILTAVC